jgi:hypothetical protein
MEFEENPNNWFMSYLTNKRQKVEVKSLTTAENFFSD